MRILLDESLPRVLGLRLPGHQCRTVVACGWSGIKNGKLLGLAAVQFDAFITADRSLEFQQNLSSLPLAVVVLLAHDNRIETIEPLVPELLELLTRLAPRTLRKVGAVR